MTRVESAKKWRLTMSHKVHSSSMQSANSATESLGRAQPGAVGQSVEKLVLSASTNATRLETATIVREVTEIYSETPNADLLPVSPATFRLLKSMRGSDAKFRSIHQAAALQTIISNPGYSYLVVLPTGGGKSDLAFPVCFIRKAITLCQR
ncbi:hypothetical protein V1509DRAFT_636056 [Lipomyces kononenkoae]